MLRVGVIVLGVSDVRGNRGSGAKRWANRLHEDGFGGWAPRCWCSRPAHAPRSRCRPAGHRRRTIRGCTWTLPSQTLPSRRPIARLVALGATPVAGQLPDDPDFACWPTRGNRFCSSTSVTAADLWADGEVLALGGRRRVAGESADGERHRQLRGSDSTPTD